MSDDFDLRLRKELRALADAVPLSPTIRPIAVASGHMSGIDAGPRTLTSQVRVRHGMPAGLAAAAIALLLIVVAGAGLYGGTRGGRAGASGSPTESPTSGPDRSAAPGAVAIEIQPKVFAEFGSDPLTAVVLGPDDAAYVLDEITDTVYRVDLQTGARIAVVTIDQTVPGPNKMDVVGAPGLLATGGGDVLVLDGNGILWIWHPAPGSVGRGVLKEVNIPDRITWGTNVRVIGTFLVNSQLQQYNVYVVSPSEWQVIKYPPAADGSGYPSLGRANYLSVSTDLSSVDDMYVDGKIYLVDKGKITQYQEGQAVDGWSPATPPGGSEAPFYTRLVAENSAQDQGTFYAYDSANKQIVAFSKADGAIVARYVAPAKSGLLTALTGMFVTTDAKGANPTLYWTEGGNLMTASLNAAALNAAAQPSSSATPVPSVSGGSGMGPTYFTYGVSSGETLSSIAQIWGVQESEIRALNPQITDWSNLVPGTVLNIPGTDRAPIEVLPSLRDTFTYRVIAGDTADIIANRFAISLTGLEWANPQINNDQIHVGEILNIPLPNFQTPPATPAH
jgi:LysM repeat protein